MLFREERRRRENFMKYFIPFFCFLSLLCSCSDDKINIESEGNNHGAGGDFSEGQYVAIRLGGLSSPGSKATEYTTGNDPHFEDGKESEWKVLDGSIYLFTLPKGTTLSSETENEAVCVSEVVLEVNSDDSSDLPELTKEVSITGKVDNLYRVDIDKYDYYAVVIINPAVDFPFPDKDQTFGEWKYSHVNDMWRYEEDTCYITMTNAPEWQADGDPVTLQKIDMSTMKPVKEELTESAGTFYVQRGAAKITVDAPNFWNAQNNVYVNKNEGCNAGDIVIFYGFTPENINQVSYPVQITEGLSKDFSGVWSTQRFFDKTSSFHRVYWGKDPNYYSGEQYSKKLEIFRDYPELLTNLDELPHAAGTGGDVLIHENTMEVDCQNNLYSTRIIDRAVYFPFKCILGDYENEGITDYQEYLRAQNLAEDPAFKWNSEWASSEKYPSSWTSAQFNNDESLFFSNRYQWMLQKAEHYAWTLKSREATGDYDEDGHQNNYDFITERSLVMTKDGEKKWFKYQFVDIVYEVYSRYASSASRDDFDNVFTSYPSNYFTLRDLLPREVLSNTVILNAVLSALGIDNLNREMTYYKHSVMYYYVILRHFLDSQGVTWEPSDFWYNGNNAKYLGRWGAVRNNWYFVSIKAAKKPGDPFVPEIEDKPNDEGDNPLEIDFKVIDWSRRDVTVGF